MGSAGEIGVLIFMGHAGGAMCRGQAARNSGWLVWKHKQARCYALRLFCVSSIQKNTPLGRLLVFEKIAHAIKEPAVFFAWTRGEVGHIAEFFQQLALFITEFFGRPDIDVYQLVASAVAALYVGQALVFEAEYFASLGTCGYFDLHLAFDGRYFD